MPLKPVSSDTDTDSAAGEKTRLGKQEYTALGIGSGAVAVLFIPIVFGLLSVFCGVQLYRRHSEPRGLFVMLWGGVGLILGVLFGIAVWG